MRNRGVFGERVRRTEPHRERDEEAEHSVQWSWSGERGEGV